MTKHITVAAVTVLSILLAAAPAAAQQRPADPWSFEARLAGAAQMDEEMGQDLDRGLGFEATFGYRFLPHLGVYAGWDWVSFGSDRTFAGEDMDFDETGYVLGLRYEKPIRGEAGPGVWLRAGGTWNHVEIEDPDGDVVADSGHGLGWEVGGGLTLPLGVKWSVTPGLRYRSLSEDVSLRGVDTDVDLSYVTVGIGLSRAF